MDSKYILRSEGIIIVDRGAWVSGEDYDAGNLSQNSGSFLCTVGHTASAATEPGVGANWATVWKPLQVVTGTYESNYFKAADTIPYLRLVDGAGNDVSIRLNAGVLEFYDNLNTKNYEKTDCQVALDIARGVATVGTTGVVGGTWTLSEGASDNIQKITRTAAAADHYYRIPIAPPQRIAAGKGAKLTSIVVNYTIGGTIDTTNDVLQFQILKQTLGTDGSAPTASIRAGDDDADYDASHNTQAERMAAGSHTLTVTIPAGEQAYAAKNETFALRVRVKDAATASLTFVLLGAVANYSAVEY